MIYQPIVTARRNLELSWQRQTTAVARDAGPRWGAYGHWLREHIDTIQSIGDLLRVAIDIYGYEFRNRKPPGKAQIQGQMQTILAEFPEAVASLLATRESALLQHPSIAGMASDDATGGVSDNLFSLQRMHFAAAAYCGRPQTVCEIGGGYGAPARIWLRSRYSPCRRYEIVDLPESLYFAEAFLRTEFPDKAIIYGHEPYSGPADIVLHPAYLVDDLRVDADLILNTLSMPEMPDEWVAAYGRFLDRSTARYFYSYNGVGRPVDGMQEHVAVIAPRLSRSWGARHIRTHVHGARNWVCEGVYERVADTDDWSCHYRRLFDATQRLHLTPQSYVVSIDCLRYLDDPDRTSTFLDRTLRDLAIMPKELLHFAVRIGRKDVVDRILAVARWHERGGVGEVVHHHREVAATASQFEQ